MTTNKPLSPRQQAKREKMPYVKLVIDTRYSEENGVCVELEMLPRAIQLELVRTLYRQLIGKRRVREGGGP